MRISKFYTREAAEKFQEIVSGSGKYRICEFHGEVKRFYEGGRRIYKVICL